MVLYHLRPGGSWQGDGTPLLTIANGSVNGGVFVEGGHGLTYENPYIEYFRVPDGMVKYARLYISEWNVNPGDTLDVIVNGDVLEVNSQPDYTALGVSGYSYNATGYIISGLNEVTVNYDNQNGGPYGVMLVAVYEDPELPAVSFWINEGNYALAYTNNKDATTTTFKDCVPGTDAVLYTLIIAGTRDEIDELYFDSTLIGSDVGCSKTGKYYDMDMFNVTITAQESEVRFERGDEGYIHPFAAVLVAESKFADESYSIRTYEI